MADKIMEALTRRTDSSRAAIKNVADMFGLADNISVQTLPIDKLKENKNHTFRLIDDESLDALAKSIKEDGLIQPVIVRLLDGGYYELLAGHRRTLACKKNGSSTIKAFVVDADDETANRIMINTNLQQRELLPSEIAKSYRLRYEDLKKHQDSSGLSLSPDSHISKLMEQEFGASKSKIYMYLRLSYLIDELLDALNGKSI